MGESFVMVNIINDGSLSQGNAVRVDKLRIKLCAGPSNGEILCSPLTTLCSYFNPSSDIIRIGRLNNCEIPIEDTSLSKCQAHIEYAETRGWVLTDGYEGKASTNGTWLYLSEETEIDDGFIFKAHQTLFSVSPSFLMVGVLLITSV